ncbi:GAF and ANTAR domain-containing protein [Pseudonocardia spinosispora]|uniref:GAF and ANTAR domain-containing protein n=1 Tax=Pseudonocardia spinosispora TaxID=103441 RepID=UPI00040695B9|nr:GAF and ANTAR domain-containing protein [Pseudonocardia spinosispora]
MVQTQAGRERLLTRAFVDLTDTLVDDYDMIELLDRLVGYSVGLFTAEAAAIMVIDARGQLHAVASSSQDADVLDLLQVQADQGPCVECIRTGAPVSVPDLSEAEHRWPRFAAIISRRTTFASVHALPLRLRGEAIGALNLFHRQPGPLPEDDLVVAQALADVATVGILQERAIHRGEIVNEQLQHALNSRIIIEQAKGVLSQHLGLRMDQAFDQLRGYARGHNLRLADVARQLVTRELDPGVLSSSTPTSAQVTQR